MKHFLFGVLFLFVSFVANAHELHSESYCSAEDSKVCAHIGYDQEFTTEKYDQFVYHVTVPNADQIENLTVELWMDMGNGHGHGSVPVQFEKFGPGQFNVTNVYFIMMGQWQIKTSFALEGKTHHIVIPVQINK